MRWVDRRRERADRGPATAMAAFPLAAAYEWLVSGHDKVLAGNFPQALRRVLADAMKANPQGWETGFLKGVVLPCCAILALAPRRAAAEVRVAGRSVRGYAG